MLERLHIQNIAVIDEVEIEFQNGFNVLTGETGAGKSIIIDSINMVLGGRTSHTLIRNGAQKATVEALFSVGPKTAERLASCGVEIEDGTLLLYRDLNNDGKSICRINGKMATAGILREIAGELINIHGQQDNQALLTPSKHLGFLDAYANTGATHALYTQAYQQVQELKGQIDALQCDEQEQARKQDLYAFELEEIDGANLKPGEDDALTARKTYLGSIGKIAETLDSARSALYAGEHSAYDALSAAANAMGEIAGFDQPLDELYNRLNSLALELDDVVYQLRDYREHIEYNDSELNEIENRLDFIHKLKRKYGNTIEEILAYRNEAEQQLQTIQHSDERLHQLQQELAAAQQTQSKLAQQLTRLRTEAAETLSVKICSELADLDMAKVKFQVQITPCGYNKNGGDSVEFLISVNAGEPLKPLSKIASGGEMSRIMLAIKSIFADADLVETLIFDEIDTGVSGRAAQKIAEKINKISAKKQVLCITHLAQLAAMAKTQYRIEKRMEDDKTFTSVRALNGDERQQELARIIGGAQITELTLQAAAEMLELAQKLRGDAQ